MTVRPEKRPPVKKSGAANRAKKHTDELLDEALEESFPASDPPAVPATPKSRSTSKKK